MKSEWTEDLNANVIKYKVWNAMQYGKNAI